jgi:hypothetical protein
VAPPPPPSPQGKILAMPLAVCFILVLQISKVCGVSKIEQWNIVKVTVRQIIALKHYPEGGGGLTFFLI